MTVEDAADRASFFDITEFAESATYQPQFGAEFAITVVPDKSRASIEVASGLDIIGPRRIVWVRKDELAEAARGDRVLWDGNSYYVSACETDISGEIWFLDLSLEPFA